MDRKREGDGDKKERNWGEKEWKIEETERVRGEKDMSEEMERDTEEEREIN